MSNAVPLNTLSQFVKTTEPLAVTHQGQFPAITVSFLIFARECRARQRHYRGRQSAEGYAHAAQPAGRFSRHSSVVYQLAVE